MKPWMHLVPNIIRVYNCTPKQATGKSPHELFFGEKPVQHLVLDPEDASRFHAAQEAPAFAQDEVKEWERVVVRERMEKAVERSDRAFANRFNLEKVALAVGDAVVIREVQRNKRKRNNCLATAHAYFGRVQEVKEGGQYKLSFPEKDLAPPENRQRVWYERARLKKVFGGPQVVESVVALLRQLALQKDTVGVVESVLDMKRAGGMTWFLVKWEGHSVDKAQWVAEEEVGSLAVVQEYLKEHFLVSSVEREAMKGGVLHCLVSWTGYQEKTWEPVCALQHTEAYRAFKARGGRKQK